MKKREFLKVGAIGFAGLTLSPSIVKAASSSFKNELRVSHVFSSFNDVSNFMNANDLESHYTNHYIQSERRLKKLMRKNGLNPPLINFLKNSQNISPEVLDNAGEFMNHRLFWKTIAKTNNNYISDNLKRDIEKSFESVPIFESKFNVAAKDFKDKEGWIWLTASKGKMKIVKTSGNENPFFSSLPEEQQGYPLFGLDMWQHAYKNRYASEESYCQAFFKAINWSYVSKRHKKIS